MGAVVEKVLASIWRRREASIGAWNDETAHPLLLSSQGLVRMRSAIGPGNEGFPGEPAIDERDDGWNGIGISNDHVRFQRYQPEEQCRCEKYGAVLDLTTLQIEHAARQKLMPESESFRRIPATRLDA